MSVVIDQRPMDGAAPIRLAYVLLWIQVGLLAVAAVPTVLLLCWSWLESGLAFGEERGGWSLFLVLTAAVTSALCLAGTVLAALFSRGRNGLRWSIVGYELIAALPGVLTIVAMRDATVAVGLMVDVGYPVLVIGLLITPAAKAYFNR